jgi:hypothetical protein
MKIAIGVASKVFWLIVACVPLVPPFVLYKFQSVLSCSENGICFRSGHPFLNGEGTAIVYLAMIVLWPMCAWQLIGKHVFRGRWRTEFDDRINRSRVAKSAGKAYWLIVASIPLLYWYLFGTFQAPAGCAENGDCFKFYAPLDSVNLAAVLIAGCLLWPMCVRRLGVGKSHIASR